MIDLNITGLIIKSYGRNYIVEVDKKQYSAITKSKKNDYVVGDIVQLQLINEQQAIIVGLNKRTTLIFRSDHNRSKLIASNISQLLIVIAAKPSFNPNFLDSCLVFAESQQLPAIIIINKIDLPESLELIQQIYELYHQKLAYPVILVSAVTTDGIADQLLPLLQQHQSSLIGQSGVGKSSLTNILIPGVATATADISKSGRSGTHTTTHATFYHLNQSSDIIDCPGLHEFGLFHLARDQVDQFFPELTSVRGKCRFRNCLHLKEPDCAVQQAHNLGIISTQRFSFLQYLYKYLQNN